MSSLEFEHLDVWFGDGATRVDAVRDVSFTVPQGASFGLVGESGSGKSTILRALVGLVPSWSGAIKVGGEPLGHKRSRSFFSDVQMVFQDPYASLHPRLTVDAVLSETLKLHGFRDIDERIPKLLADVGLGPQFRFRYPHQISGGQRQRVALARALAPEPSVLLLDEPTSALDVSVQAEVLNLLQDLRDEHGLSYLMVSHNLAVVAHMCDTVAVMQNGELVEVMGVEAMRNMEPEQDYTRRLLEGAMGYQRHHDAATGRA